MKLVDVAVQSRHLLLQNIPLLFRFFELCAQFPFLVFFISHGSLQLQHFFLSLHQRLLVVFQASLKILFLFQVGLTFELGDCNLVRLLLFLFGYILAHYFQLGDQIVNLAFDGLTHLVLRLEHQFCFTELIKRSLLLPILCLSSLVGFAKLFAQPDDHRLRRLLLLLLLGSLQESECLPLRSFLLHLIEALFEDFDLVLQIGDMVSLRFKLALLQLILRLFLLQLGQFLPEAADLFQLILDQLDGFGLCGIIVFIVVFIVSVAE